MCIYYFKGELLIKFRKLGNSNLKISRIGIGGLFSGSWKMIWEKKGEKESIKAIHTALDHGINWIDTAPLYGFGRSEEIIGKALKLSDTKPFIFTKCGFRWDKKKKYTPNLTAQSIKEEVELSLKRLSLEVIDLYQIHWPDPEEYIEEAWQALSLLKKEGKIRYIGVSNHNIKQMDKLIEIAPITSLQPQYNAITRYVEAEILPYCLKKRIGTIVYSPMASGLLAGKMSYERIENMDENDLRKNDKRFNEPNVSKNIEIANIIENIAMEKKCNTAEVSIAWTLKNPSVTGAIVGVRNQKQVMDVINGSDIVLTNNDMERISEPLYRQ